MIVVRLMGGLGNQMFQYALGRRLALKRNVPLILDLTWFGVQKKRMYELGQFNIQAQIANPFVIEQISPFSHHNLVRGGYCWIANNLPFCDGHIFREQKDGNFDPKVFESKNLCFLEGYWQSEKYFKPIEDQIRADFTLKRPLSLDDQRLVEEMRNNPNSVSVHVRRGDYVSDLSVIQRHYICTPDYYLETMRWVNQKLGRDVYYYIFSDDPDWCCSGLDYPSQYKIVSTKERSSVQELILMSNCRHAIISNSSFSWWGAWLINDPQKTVVYPKKWFNNLNVPDIPPENWFAYQHNPIKDWEYIDIPYAKSRYKATYGYELDLENPQTFSEKIQWLKIFDRKPMYTSLADKFSVRNYIAEKIGGEYLTKLFGVYKKTSEIEWDMLPAKFVLKGTHGSGWVIRCEKKDPLNIQRYCQQMDGWLEKNYFYFGREWVFKDILPRVICEEYLEADKNLRVLEYQFFCFNGKPKYIQLYGDRNIEHKREFFDLDWKKLGFSFQNYPRPHNLGKMINIVQKLSLSIPFIRVDLNSIGERLVLKKFVFYPEAGFEVFYPPDLDKVFGDDLILPC